MTRNEFDNISTMDELFPFIWDEELYDCIDILTDDDLDERICDRIRDMSHSHTWDAIKSYLNDITEGYDYYKYDSYYDTYTALTDIDVEGLKDRIIDYGFDFDEEEPEMIESEAESDYEEEEFETPDEGIELMQLLSEAASIKECAVKQEGTKFDMVIIDEAYAAQDAGFEFLFG